LPRVTAYCTAGCGILSTCLVVRRTEQVSLKFHTSVRRFDEAIYTPYAYDPPKPKTAPLNPSQPSTGDLLGVPELNATESSEDRDVSSPTDTRNPAKHPRTSRFHNQQPEGESEIFLFEYGTVVMWGMTEAQEKRFLSSIRRFEVEKLPSEDVEMEDLNYYYADYSRIYNDVMFV